MKSFWQTASIVAVCVSALSAHAADWYQWRGPQRNGIVGRSPALLGEFPEAGLKELWKSEEIRGEWNGGWGSVVVADGRAYVFSNWNFKMPITSRTLSGKALGELGWVEEMSADLRNKLEEARLSQERAALEKKEERSWATQWVKANVPEDQKELQSACQKRLLEGDRAVPLGVLEKLVPIADERFKDQEELDHWLNEHRIEGSWREVVLKKIPTSEPRADDKVFCLDAATGETLWVFERVGRRHKNGYNSSSTPLVVNGRLYVAGSDAGLYCLDARTGEVVWERKTHANPGEAQASSFVLQDGVVVLLAGPLTGLDPDTGKILWTQPKVTGTYASPAYWHTGDTTYLVCVGQEATFCFEAGSGEILWSVPGGGWSTPAIAGDRMVVLSNSKEIGLVAYELAADGPRELWRNPLIDRGASPLITDGYVYVVGGRDKAKAMCLELETGKVAWEHRLPSTEFSSPVLADGKLFVVVGKSLLIVEATPAEYRQLGMKEMDICPCSSVALVDGKAYLRLRNAVASFDLRRAANRQAAAE